MSACDPVRERLVDVAGGAEDAGVRDHVAACADCRAELDDLSARSLRSKISLFKEEASWPGSVQPLGYGKRCYSRDGRLLWEWQPTASRLLGRLSHADAGGNLTPGPEGVPVPRKTKGARERTVLVPSSNPEHVRAVRLIFELYVRQGLSRRQISHRLNREGLLQADRLVHGFFLPEHRDARYA